MQFNYCQNAHHAIKANICSEEKVDGFSISNKTCQDSLSGVKSEYADCNVPVELKSRTAPSRVH